MSSDTRNELLLEGPDRVQTPLFAKVYISKLLRKLCILVLLFLPFQGLPRTLLGFIPSYGGPGAAPIPPPPQPFWLKSLQYVDEMSFIVFFSVAITFFLMKPSSFRLPKLALNKWLMAFLVYGFLLAGFKGIPWAQATFGIYDRLKNIAVLYLFCSINFKRGEFFATLRSLMIIGFLLAVFGFFAEVLAVGIGWGIGYFVMDEARLGFYRVVSLTGSGNHVYLGSYVILILFLGHALIKNRTKRFIQDASLLLLLFLTFSRAGLVCICCHAVLFLLENASSLLTGAWRGGNTILTTI